MTEVRAITNGQCLCGAVRFTARNVAVRVGVCHCDMCQRWTGVGLAEVSIPEKQVSWDGDTIQTYASSAWGERAFCNRCGSGLWFRMTEDGDFSGTYDIPLGLFEDRGAFILSHEIFVDHRSVSMHLEDQGQRQLTRAECVEKFPRLDEGRGALH